MTLYLCARMRFRSLLPDLSLRWQARPPALQVRAGHLVTKRGPASASLCTHPVLDRLLPWLAGSSLICLRRAGDDPVGEATISFTPRWLPRPSFFADAYVSRPIRRSRPVETS